MALLTEDELMELLEAFGGRIIELVEGTWKLQKDGIERSGWYKKLGHGKAKMRMRNSSAVMKREDTEAKGGTENAKGAEKQGATKAEGSNKNCRKSSR